MPDVVGAMLGEEDPEAAGPPDAGLMPFADENVDSGLSAGVSACKEELKGAGAGDGTADMLGVVYGRRLSKPDLIAAMVVPTAWLDVPLSPAVELKSWARAAGIHREVQI